MSDAIDLASGNWRKSPCLGCGELTRRARDAWIEIVGTRSGSWLAAVNVDPLRMVADELPPPADEPLVALGVAHNVCLELSVARLRRREIELPDVLPIAMLEVLDHNTPLRQPQDPTPVGECPFCQGHGRHITNEDIYPKWLLRYLESRGARMVRDDRTARRLGGLVTPVCNDCNNTWMSTIENDVKYIIVSMLNEPRGISIDEQRRLALWAAVKGVLFDRVGGAPVLPLGVGHDLNIKRRPHPEMRIWIAAYSDMSSVLEAHPWRIFTPKGSSSDHPDELLGYCMTFSIVHLVFQVFVPIIGGSLAELENFDGSVLQIWPTAAEELSWPPRWQFDRHSIVALARRIFDNREPVEMEVTLKRTDIHEPRRRRPFLEGPAL
ncbi:hypothetical protein [Dactylosporangium sp. CS-033363]|uniref:hypothetical protein n=1 Tax=Dactylosporangium sp. CS-033363 TaxID=3239935 RepID=UPI003D8E5A94